MTMQPAAGPRPISPDWAACTPETRATLDALCGVGPEPEHRFGVFLEGGDHHPELPSFHSLDTARRMAEEGQHVRRGVVLGSSSFGRERVRWEDTEWAS